MRKKKVLSSVLLCVSLLAGTAVLPLAMQAAAGCFVEWVTGNGRQEEIGNDAGLEMPEGWDGGIETETGPEPETDAQPGGIAQ